MKKFIILPLLLGFCQVAYSANSISANHQVVAKIIRPIQAESSSALDFGQVMVTGKGGTVTVNLPSADKEVRTKTNNQNGVIELVGGSGVGSNGVIKITGNGPVNVVLPSNQVSFKSAPGSNVYVSDFRSNASNNQLALVDGVPSELRIGATLHLPEGTAIGDYSGTYPIKITYQ